MPRQLFPKRNHAHFHLSDDMLALCHALDEILAGKLEKLPPGYAEGAEPQESVRSRNALHNVTEVD